MASYTYSEHSEGCKCCRLKNGHDLPIPKDLSLDEIAVLARKFSHTIYADWTKLNAILKRFEGVIQKRWAKKNFKQRRDILLKACPGIPTEHRPDFVSFRNTTNRKLPRSVTQPSAAYLWPYINLEDLSKQNLLPLYLHSRGRNLPHVFLELDIRSAHLGKGWKFAHDAEPGSTKSMRFHPGSPRSYGRTVRGSTTRHKHAATHHQHPALGLLALEIQNGIYTFLLTCAKLILHDIEPKEFLLAPSSTTPVPPQSFSHDRVSLVAHQLETPYRAPHMLDLARVQMLVNSRRTSAEDHLWSLKEDPGYFVNCFEEWAEYNESMLKHGCPDCAQIVAGTVVTNALKSFIFWDGISIDFDFLESPDKHHYIWIALLWLLDVLETVILDELESIKLSPRLRRNYHVLDLIEEKYAKGMGHNYKNLTESEHRVMNLFTNLLDNDLRELHTTNHLVQELQYLLEIDKNANELLDSWVAGRFSDLALVTELRFCIEILQPRFGKWRNSTKVTPLILPSAMLLDIATSFNAGIEQLCRNDTTLIGHPADGRLNYPVSKAYTKKNVDQMRHAERVLDKFWAGLEEGMCEQYGQSIADIITDRFVEPRTLYRTQEWTPPPMPASKVAVLTDISINLPHIRVTEQTSTKFETVKLKEKIKTRGSASLIAEVDKCATDSFEEVHELASAKVVVPKRTHKVLAALLPGSSAENHQRMEVAWSDFLHAMETIGLQPEKLYGSVWVFRPKTNPLVEAKRSIQFHEPKEIRHGGKISATMVRVFGRRLKRVYGWDSDMFESK